MLTSDLFILALTRMYQLSNVLNWQSQSVSSPPIWPEPAVVTREKAVASNEVKAQAVTNATTQLISILEQMTQTIHNDQSTRARSNSNTTVHQSQTAIRQGGNHSMVNGGNSTLLHQSMTQPSQPMVTTKNQWDTANTSISPSSILSNRNTTTTQKSAQTNVTISPTVHLQATIREQADLDALVTKLNRILEEEIAISAERAYT